jgi:hypothetical protein
MVEQNARQALEIADKGYVLVQGANRYTDTGKALLADPRSANPSWGAEPMRHLVLAAMSLRRRPYAAPAGAETFDCRMTRTCTTTGNACFDDPEAMAWP